VLFKDIKGQGRAVGFLKTAIEKDTLAQGYIFLGARGTGKFTTALSFAKALNCAARGKEACGECGPCRKIESCNHPDLVIVRPSDKGAREIEIDMIRDMRYLVSLKPYEFRTKVCIIDESDRMSPQAANALLKTLEEPPPGSVLVLIVENLSKLLPTIASRCQVIKFFPLMPDALEETLKEEYGVDMMKARYLSRLASGRLGEALRLKEGDLLERKNVVIDDLTSGRIFDEERFAVSKEEAPWILDVMLSWYRDIIMARLGADDEMFINIDRRDAISSASSGIRAGVEDLVRLSTEIVNCRTYLENNVNLKLAWSVLSEKVASVAVRPLTGPRG